VACGSPVDGLRVVIVDPHSRARGPDRVGEIWVAGASVGQGYCTSPARPPFLRRRLSDTAGPVPADRGPGLPARGQLYVTAAGRPDHRSRHERYPQDIEATARGSHPLLESGYGALSSRTVTTASAWFGAGVARKGEKDLTPALDAIRRAVLDEHGLALDAIVLVRSGTILRTSSARSSAMPVARRTLPGTQALANTMVCRTTLPARAPPSALAPKTRVFPGASRLALMASRYGCRPPAPRALAGAALPT